LYGKSLFFFKDKNTGAAIPVRIHNPINTSIIVSLKNSNAVVISGKKAANGKTVMYLRKSSRMRYIGLGFSFDVIYSSIKQPANKIKNADT